MSCTEGVNVILKLGQTLTYGEIFTTRQKCVRHYDPSVLCHCKGPARALAVPRSINGSMINKKRVMLARDSRLTAVRLHPLNPGGRGLGQSPDPGTAKAKPPSRLPRAARQPGGQPGPKAWAPPACRGAAQCRAPRRGGPQGPTAPPRRAGGAWPDAWPAGQAFGPGFRPWQKPLLGPPPPPLAVGGAPA